jgi:hypothetical protein
MLVKSERKRILDSLPPGSLSDEDQVERVVSSLRENKLDALRAWLSERNCTIENGKDAIQSVLDAVNAENKRQRVKDICSQLSCAVKILDPTQLRSKLQQCIEELDSL